MAKIKVTGLWRKNGQSGDYYTGSAGHTTEYVLFPNSYKKTDKDPDYVLYLSEKLKPELAPEQKPQAQAKPKVTPRQAPPNKAPNATRRAPPPAEIPNFDDANEIPWPEHE